MRPRTHSRRRRRSGTTPARCSKAARFLERERQRSERERSERERGNGEARPGGGVHGSEAAARSSGDEDEPGSAVVLAAADPAQPYGAWTCGA